ncbi:MAG: penicillin acylase family protein [Candidatus Pacebacteria bacterium]|nr:penicillin acylase family protein [Candidatus Paceibacterota bacterium]
MLDTPVALNWPAYQRDRTAKGFFGLMRSTNFTEFMKFSAMMDASATALTFAMVDGHIGFRVSGSIPRRNSVVDAVYIRDGTDPAEDPLGTVPEEEMPLSLDPEEGYIASCNNIVFQRASNGTYGVTGSTTARAVRVVEIIEGRIKNKQPFDPAVIMKMQNDTVDVYGRSIVPSLLAVVARHLDSFPGHITSGDRHAISRMVRVLKTWDYDVSPQSAGALAYNAWVSELRKLLVTAQFPDPTVKSLFANMHPYDQFVGHLFILWGKNQSLDSRYCVTSENGNMALRCPYNVLRSLVNAYDKIVRSLGDDEVPKRKLRKYRNCGAGPGWPL